MKIIIEYHSIWQNSVLDGSNDELFHKKSNPRNFKVSSKSTEKPDVKEITLNTVLGILYRLIGDQRKLYQTKREFYQVGDYNFHFKDMDISFELKKTKQWIETVSLIRKNDSRGRLADRPPPTKFLGVLDENEPLFFSEYSATFWSVLDLSFDELLDFIIQPSFKKIETEVSPSHILNRIQFGIGEEMEDIEFIENKIKFIQDKIQKEKGKSKPSEKTIQNLNKQILLLQDELEKQSDFECKVKKCLKILESKYGESYLEKSGNLKPIRFYSASLYLMRDLLKEHEITLPFLTDKDGVKGFSVKGFNGVRDFLNSLTGGKKQTTHTPYDLTKSDGRLEITLNLDPQQAVELKQMIDNAGVSSFYLGKKGLAYVVGIYE